MPVELFIIFPYYPFNVQNIKRCIFKKIPQELESQYIILSSCKRRVLRGNRLVRPGIKGHLGSDRKSSVCWGGGWTTKHPFFRKIYLPGVRRRSLSAREVRFFICSDSRCLKCWTWAWKNCCFSLVILGPFMDKSISKWMLSSWGEAQEGEQRSKSIYCNRVEPWEVCNTRVSLQDLWRMRTVSKILRFYCPWIVFLSGERDKVLAHFINWYTKEMEILRNGILPATSVNKACHSHQQLQPALKVSWPALREFRKETVSAKEKLSDCSFSL